MGVYYGMNGLWVPVGGQGGAADSNLLAENIKSGVTISGVTGTFTNDGTATASDMASGVTAYVNGQKITSLSRGVLIRVVGPEGWMRVCMGTDEEMKVFRKALIESMRVVETRAAARQ